jgi:hypothetical protein
MLRIMALSNRRRQQLGIILAVLGFGLSFVAGYTHRLALDSGASPPLDAFNLPGAIIGGLGVGLAVVYRARRG